jgi:hypothetical protein
MIVSVLRQPVWARIAFVVVGAWAIVVGGALAVAAVLTMAGAWELALVFGLAGAAATVVLGALILTQLAVRVRCDATGLYLPMASQSRLVPWSRVIAYRKMGVRRGIKRVDERSARGSTFIELEYEPPGREKGRPERVYFWLAGTGPASATSTESFVTPLDEFVPDKRRLGKAARENRRSLRPR